MKLPVVLVRCLVVLGVVLLVAACGNDDASKSSSSSKTSTTTSTSSKTDDAPTNRGGTADIEASLKIKVGPLGSKTAVPEQPLPEFPKGTPCTRSIPYSCIVSIECPADEICSKFSEHPKVLDVPDEGAGRACTMIYGGDITAHVTGTLNGKPIGRTFSRENGCAISDYDKASFLWDRSDGRSKSGSAPRGPQ